MRRLTEAEALSRLRRGKAAFQTDIKLNFEHRARDCRRCPTPGACCTDEHFVNVNITRLEAVAIRETLERTPLLREDDRRAVYARARDAVVRYALRAGGDTFARTFACPLFVAGRGCLVHRRAKPAPCIQHACYDDWTDVPPLDLQWRAERRIERLNVAAYGSAWAWLPLPLWLTLVDPAADKAELDRLAHTWSARHVKAAPDGRPRRILPLLRA